MHDNCAKRYYHQKIIKDVTDPGGVASEWGERVHTALENRVKLKTPLPPELEKHEPLCAALDRMGGQVFAEQELVLDKNLTPTTWWADDAWLRSKLDILVLSGKKAVIIDWKTGKRRPDFLQLELSAAQVFLHYPYIETVNTAFVWLKEGTMDAEAYKREHLAGILKDLHERTRNIEEALETGIWPAKPSGLCGYCPVAFKCEFAQKRKWKR